MSAGRRGQKRNLRMSREGRARNRRWSAAVRPRPLSAKTMRRIQEGVQRFFGAPLGAVVDLFADLPRGIPQNAGLTLSVCSPPFSRLEHHRVGTRDGIRHAVLSVPGVTSVEITANETAETDAAGIPPHSILVVVTGGDDAHVARSLLESIPAGIGVRWTRPPVGGASVETPDTCYSCGISGAALYERGGQLYQCEARRVACSNLCCSEHSETVTESDTGSSLVYCLRCYDAGFEDGND